MLHISAALSPSALYGGLLACGIGHCVANAIM